MDQINLIPHYKTMVKDYMSYNFNLIPKYLLDKRKKFINRADRIIEKLEPEKELYFDGSDIYEIALLKIAEGKRSWNESINADIQFTNILKSIAVNMLNKEKRKHYIKEEKLIYEESISRLPVTTDGRCRQALIKLRKWINESGNNELIKYYELFVSGCRDTEIANHLKCSLYHSRYLKKKIRNKLKSFYTCVKGG